MMSVVRWPRRFCTSFFIHLFLLKIEMEEVEMRVIQLLLPEKVSAKTVVHDVCTAVSTAHIFSVIFFLNL